MLPCKYHKCHPENFWSQRQERRLRLEERLGMVMAAHSMAQRHEDRRQRLEEPRLRLEEQSSGRARA